ncbi:MAG TPA: hypothetical protein VGX96_16050, partial [Candidatus Elarobacter sp.]|nr:hypothetical protein [Candidatus Elarobacter sp.]
MSSAPPPAHDPTRTAEALFSRSWAVFRKNWNVAIPPLIAGAIGLITIVPLTVIAALVVILGYKHSGTAAPFDVRLVGASLTIVAVVNIVVGLWSYAAMYGMADAAWTRGTASFGDGWSAFLARGGAVLVSWVAVVLLAIAAVIVALPTLGISVIALPLVTMYVAPSVVVGGRGGFAAVGESFRLVRRSLGRSSLILLMQFAISYGIGTIASFG